MNGVMVASGNEQCELKEYKALIKSLKAQLEVLQQELKNCHNDIWWYRERIRTLEEKIKGN